MKTMITALALLSLAAGPVFAQNYIPLQRGYYGPNPNSPVVTEQSPTINVWGHRLTSPALTEQRPTVNVWGHRLWGSEP
jgi:hypothetical protein